MERADMASERYDALILTMLPEEHRAVLDRMTDPRLLQSPDGMERHGGRIGDVNVVLARLTNAGQEIQTNAQVGAPTALLIRAYMPRWVILLGVAGGIATNDVGLGDVVIPKMLKSVYGKINENYQRRDRFDSKTSHLVQQWLQSVRNDKKEGPLLEDSWRERIVEEMPATGATSRGRLPKLHFDTRGPNSIGEPQDTYVISGEWVIDSFSHQFVQDLLIDCPDVLAFEMEGVGVGAAVRSTLEALDHKVDYIVIRGICDLPGTATESGTEVRDPWKRYAAAAAAAALDTLFSLPNAYFTRDRASEQKEINQPVQGPPKVLSIPLEAEFQPLSVAKDPLILPPQFQGRESELIQLNKWHEEGVEPVLAIVGFPEIGKSWLVRKWNHDQGGRTKTIDAVMGEAVFDSPENQEAQVASYVLDRIRESLGNDLTRQAPISPNDLAQQARKQDVVWVIDHMESMLVGKSSPNTRQEHKVGEAIEDMTRFIRTFMEVSGPGRLILISNFRPKDIVNKKFIESGRVRMLYSPGSTSSDALRPLGGLSHDDAMTLLRNGLKEYGSDKEDIDEEQMRAAIQRFEGHPVALSWFAQLERSQKLQMLAGHQHMLSRELNNLLTRVIEEKCDRTELNLLELLALATRPESPSLIHEVSGLTSYHDVVKSLEHLIYRAFIEYLPQSASYRVHELVRQWVNDFRLESEPVRIEIHTALALAYAKRVEQSADSGDQESARVDFSRLTMHHYSLTNDQKEFLRWRAEYGRLSFETGKRAYSGGDYESALVLSDEFIEAMEPLPSTDHTKDQLSRAYHHRAVSQRRLDPTKGDIYGDLSRAVELWPGNAHALNFAKSLIQQDLREMKVGFSWQRIECSLHNIIEAASYPNQARPKSNDVSVLLELVGLRTQLLRSFPNRSYSEANAEKLIELLRLLQHIDPRREKIGESGYITWVQALLTIGLSRGVLDTKTQSIDLHASTIEAGILAATARKQFPNSSDLIMLQARIEDLKGRMATNREDALLNFETGLRYIKELLDGFLLPRGAASIWSEIIEDHSRFQDRESAVASLVEAESELANLKLRDSLHPLNQKEVNTARVRLLLRLGALNKPENREEYFGRAYELVEHAFDNPEYLTPEMADMAIQMLLETADEGSVDSGLYSANSTKTQFQRIDDVLEKAYAIFPATQYQVLKLKQRLVWFRFKKQMLESSLMVDTRALAEKLTEDYPNDARALIVVAEFWAHVARVADTRVEFEEAFGRGSESLRRLMSLPRPPRMASYVNARFYRWLLDEDYQTARSIIRGQTEDHLVDQMSLFERERWSRLYLDTVAHAVSKPDPKNSDLMLDARRAVRLQDDYLAAIGPPFDELIKRPDEFTDFVEDYRRAQEVLWRIRCQIFLGDEDLLSLEWLQELIANVILVERRDTQSTPAYVSSNLSQHSASTNEKPPLAMENVQILLKLHGSREPVGKILAMHASNPVIWREIGTLVASSGEDTAQEWSRAFWELAILMAERVAWKGDAHETSKLSLALLKLNRGRALVTGSIDDASRLEGIAVLRDLADSHTLPWLYRRYAVNIVDNSS